MPRPAVKPHSGFTASKLNLIICPFPSQRDVECQKQVCNSVGMRSILTRQDSRLCLGHGWRSHECTHARFKWNRLVLEVIWRKLWLLSRHWQSQYRDVGNFSYQKNLDIMGFTRIRKTTLDFAWEIRGTHAGGGLVERVCARLCVFAVRSMNGIYNSTLSPLSHRLTGSSVDSSEAWEAGGTGCIVHSKQDQATL